MHSHPKQLELQLFLTQTPIIILNGNKFFDFPQKT